MRKQDTQEQPYLKKNAVQSPNYTVCVVPGPRLLEIFPFYVGSKHQYCRNPSTTHCCVARISLSSKLHKNTPQLGGKEKKKTHQVLYLCIAIYSCLNQSKERRSLASDKTTNSKGTSRGDHFFPGPLTSSEMKLAPPPNRTPVRWDNNRGAIRQASIVNRRNRRSLFRDQTFLLSLQSVVKPERRLENVLSEFNTSAQDFSTSYTYSRAFGITH